MKIKSLFEKFKSLSKGYKILLGAAMVSSLLSITYNKLGISFYTVHSNSMYPKFKGEDLCVAMRPLGLKRGSICAVARHLSTVEREEPYTSANSSLLIKRLIAKPGDKLRFESAGIFLNGEYLEEDYVKGSQNYNVFIVDDSWNVREHNAHGIEVETDSKTFKEFVLPEGCYFFLGDNRNYSEDSRSSVLGIVEEKQIDSVYLFTLKEGETG